MALLKIPLKLIALPLVLTVTLIKWIGIFLTSFTGAILYLLSGLFFLVGVLSYLMGICTGAESIEMLVIGFVIFILPVMAGWLIGMVAAVGDVLWDFIWS